MLDFLGIGAQNCGTSWLFENLRKHPRIHFPSDIQERHFKNHHTPGNTTPLHHYLWRFKRKFFGIQGEITPAYALLEIDAIKRIYSLYPKLKLLYIIRDPRERAWFSALMALSKTEITFDEASDSWFLDHFHSEGSLTRGNYRSCIHRWLSAFPAEQFCLLDYNDIHTAPVTLLQHCCHHLGVDPSFFTPDTVIHDTILPQPSIATRPVLQRALTKLYDGSMHAPLELLPGAPIVVGGTSGSGTRVIQKILEQAGIFTGTDHNVAGDLRSFIQFLGQHISRVLQETTSANYSISDCSQPLQDAVLFSLKKTILSLMQQAPSSTQKWGWKNPRNIYLLPFMHHVFPKMYFVHVIRDGRTMAFSDNQGQCNQYYATYFGRPLDKTRLPEASIELWSKMNIDAATWAQKYLGARYIRVHFETLCHHPQKTILSLLSQLAIPTNTEIVDNLAPLVAIPQSLYRWKNADPQYIKQLEHTGKAGLDYFGYLPQEKTNLEEDLCENRWEVTGIT